ncbi:MAG: class I tRNA ligase family protein [Victivallales bacterium]|jgi:leucyl-tRNA synthetase|nr:class I tRNA ligase family protein [Victivallales bacterium]
MSDSYNHHEIESKWRDVWERERTHSPDLSRAGRPYYNLMMFPYPSAEGLHVGNVFSYVGSDVHARFIRAHGWDVFQPMGFDAFGVHSENYAIKTGTHPARQTPVNVARFRESQLKRLACLFDWSHEVNTTAPEYYRWTQWLFIRLFEAGLVYRAEAPVNWCPSCRTVMANAMVESGCCERCRTAIETRTLPQWFARTTAFAGRLVDNLAHLDWSPRTIAAQKNWIMDADGGLRLRDWCISRQRYWGTPIPMVHCNKCGAVPVDDADLPVLLPDLQDFAPDGSGRSPLARVSAFVETTCPDCGGDARRETDVCSNFMCSAWYFLRYPSSDCDTAPFTAEATGRWLPVAMYAGGNEHAVGHLLYARFVTMALHDMGLVPFEEPFQRYRANGTITQGGAKMSKSTGKVVNPEAYIDRYGIDAFRMALMFMCPYLEGGELHLDCVVGTRRFLDRVWRYVATAEFADADPSAALRSQIHRAVKSVTGDVERFRYNTAISALMDLFRAIAAAPGASRESVRTLVTLLAPFAPVISQELWRRIGETGQVCDAPWPTWEAGQAPAETSAIPVQVNGNTVSGICIPPATDVENALVVALANDRVAQAVDGRPVIRVVHVPDRILNIVTGAQASDG